MHKHTLDAWRHDHLFLDRDALADGERRTLWVVRLTILTMVVEIAAGLWFNSMALLADGWHMGSHAAALGIAVFAYRFSRRHAEDERFTFGTGKVAVLGGYTSAVLLALIALLMVWESADRLRQPLEIAYDQAMLVAVIGLVVNLASAWMLDAGGGHHHHHHDHAHAGAHDADDDDHHHHRHHDHNLRAAYLHVVADALTSVLAIAALLAGKLLGWAWMDPAMGIVGAVIIARWAWGLLRDTGAVLVDGADNAEDAQAVRVAVEGEPGADTLVADVHVWRLGGDKRGVILSVVTHHPKPPEHYKGLLAHDARFAHVTVEVNACDGRSCYS